MGVDFSVVNFFKGFLCKVKVECVVMYYVNLYGVDVEEVKISWVVLEGVDIGQILL